MGNPLAQHTARDLHKRRCAKKSQNPKVWAKWGTEGAGWPGTQFDPLAHACLAGKLLHRLPLPPGLCRKAWQGGRTPTWEMGRWTAPHSTAQGKTPVAPKASNKKFDLKIGAPGNMVGGGSDPLSTTHRVSCTALIAAAAGRRSPPQTRSPSPALRVGRQGTAGEARPGLDVGPILGHR